MEEVANRDGLATAAAAALRTLALELDVYRGQVVSFGHSTFGERASLLRFHERSSMTADDLILPADTFADVRRQVVGVARNSDRPRTGSRRPTRLSPCRPTTSAPLSTSCSTPATR